MNLKFRNCYSPQKNVGLDFTDFPSLTEQSHKDECDIEFIINNFVKTGQLPETTLSYQDCTTVQDFQEAQMLVAECKSNFEMLPAKDRERFVNVDNYLAFISDPNNLKESYEKGYINRNSIDERDIYSTTQIPNTSSPEENLDATPKSTQKEELPPSSDVE